MDKYNITRYLPTPQAHPQSDKNRLVTAGIRSDVVLGSPSARCNGVGICRVMGQGEGISVTCPVVPASLSVTLEGCLRIAFDRSAMDEQYRQQHFRWMLFQVTEPVRLSPRMRRQLNWPSRWIIPGIYPVWETSSALVVDLNGELTSRFSIQH